MDLFRLLLISLTLLYSRANSSLFRATAATDTNTHTHTHPRGDKNIQKKKPEPRRANQHTHTHTAATIQTNETLSLLHFFSTLLAAGTEFFRGQRVHTFADERTARVIHNAISVRYSSEYSSLFSRSLFSTAQNRLLRFVLPCS